MSLVVGKEISLMKMLVPLLTIFTFAGASAAVADTYTVYQGGSDHVLGTCSDKASCKAILKANPGYGELIVNDQTGKVRNFQGRHHKNRDKGGTTSK
jgi:hypothetical protein